MFFFFFTDLIFLLKEIHILLTFAFLCWLKILEIIWVMKLKKHLASCAGVTVDEHHNQRATLGELYYYYYCSPQWALEALALGQQLGTVLDSCALSFFPITF